MQKLYSVLFCLLLLIGLALGAGCDDDDDDNNDATPSDDDTVTDDDTGADDDDDDDDDDASPPPIDDLLELGKTYLSRGEYASAYEAYRLVLNYDPDHTEALVGISLAHFQHVFGMLDMVIGLLSDYQFDGVEPDRKSATDVSDSWISSMLVHIVDNMRTMLDEQLTRLDTLKQVDDLEFRLPAYPLKLQREMMIDLHSEWDRADVYALSAFYHLLEGLICLLDSQSFDGDLDMIEDLFEDGGDIIAALAALLGDNPNLLTLDAEGDQAWQDSAAALTAAADELLTATELMAAEVDDQSDDVLVQNPSLNEGGVSHFALQGDFASGTKQVKLLWHGNRLSVRDTLARLRDNTGGDGTQRIRFEDDVVMLVGVGADFLLKGFGLRTLLDLFGDLFDKRTLAEAGITATSNGEQLPQLIIMLLPWLGVPTDAVEFDFAAFYSRPFPFRELAPNFGLDPYDGQWTFYQSFECARLGFDATEVVYGESLPLALADRGPIANANAGPGNDTATAIVHSMDGLTVVDSEWVTLNEDAEYTAVFRGSLPSAASNEIIPYDGTLQVPLDGYAMAEYEDPNGEEKIWVDAIALADGTVIDVFSYAMGCGMYTARDYNHFTQNEFADAYAIADPPAGLDPLTPYGTIAADGIAADMGYLAFKSGSFNGLLWLNMKHLIDGSTFIWGFPNDFAIADTRMTNVLVWRIVDLLRYL